MTIEHINLKHIEKVAKLLPHKTANRHMSKQLGRLQMVKLPNGLGIVPDEPVVIPPAPSLSARQNLHNRKQAGQSRRVEELGLPEHVKPQYNLQIIHLGQ